MNKNKMLLGSFFVCVLAISSAFGQTSGSKVAVFESDAFFHPTKGVSTLIDAQKKLATEMQPKIYELKKLSDQVQGIENQLRTPPPNVSPEWLRDKNDEGSRILRELEFKKSEADKFQEKRQKELIEPQVVIVTRQIMEFAKKKAIDVLIDQSRFGGSIMPVNPTIDITADLIADINASNAKVPVKP